MRKSLNEYWLENHGPIIEDVLLKYDLKLRLYDQEKPKFCYHRDNIEYCNCYPWGIGRELEDDCDDVSKENRKTSSNKYYFEYFPYGPYGSLVFEKP